MATIISAPGPEAPMSEKKVHRALAALPDEYTILHSVAWQGRWGRRFLDGEADFLVAHPRGVLVIEVKGGGIHVENGRWKSRDRNGYVHDVKNPFEQATTSSAILHKWLKERTGLDISTCHAVAFPDIGDSPELGPAASRELILARERLGVIEDAVKRVFSRGRRDFRLPPSKVKEIATMLAPTVTVRRKLSDEAREAQSELITLTDEQKDFFNAARRNVRLAVFGGAGTGKTVLACEKARQLKAEGNRVLLTCYNRPLAEALNADASLQGIEVKNFHWLCLDMASEANLDTPKDEDKDSAFWEKEAPLLLMQAAERCGVSFDAVVIDEGQDFGEDWMEALESICSHGKDSPFVVFFDSHQNLWNRSWSPDASYFQFELTKNCRNTLPIAERVASVVAAPVLHKGAGGPAPKWTEWIAPGDLEKRIQGILIELLQEGFSLTDIVVLCESRDALERLRALENIGAQPAREGKTSVYCETIARFKGLEALAVVLVLNPKPFRAPDNNAYVGFSRAVSYLRILAHPSRQKSVHWA